MQFKLAIKNQPSVFLPYKTHKRQYHLLFTREVEQGSIVAIDDSKEVFLDTFFSIGDMSLNDYDGKRCGYIFHSFFPVVCHGTCIIAYSKQWAKSVENMASIKPIGINLLLRAKHFYVYHDRNKATLIVNPSLAKHIRENLEI